MGEIPNYRGGGRPAGGPLDATHKIHDHISRNPGITVGELFEWVKANDVIDIGFARRKYAAHLNRENGRRQAKYREHVAVLDALNGREGTYPPSSPATKAKRALTRYDRDPELWTEWAPSSVREKGRDEGALWYSFAQILHGGTGGACAKAWISTSGTVITRQRALESVAGDRLSVLRPLLKKAKGLDLSTVIVSPERVARGSADLAFLRACRDLGKRPEVMSEEIFRRDGAAVWLTPAQMRAVEYWVAAYSAEDSFGDWQPSPLEELVTVTLDEWLNRKVIAKSRARLSIGAWQAMRAWWKATDKFWFPPDASA